MTFECIVKKGHRGAGSFGEQKIIVSADNALQAMDIARQRGGVKKGRSNSSGQSVLKITPVSH